MVCQSRQELHRKISCQGRTVPRPVDLPVCICVCVCVSSLALFFPPAPLRCLRRLPSNKGPPTQKCSCPEMPHLQSILHQLLPIIHHLGQGYLMVWLSDRHRWSIAPSSVASGGKLIVFVFACSQEEEGETLRSFGSLWTLTHCHASQRKKGRGSLKGFELWITVDWFFFTVNKSTVQLKQEVCIWVP